MITLTLTETQMSGLANCALVAAERFRKDAKVARASSCERIAQQFDRQAEQASELFALLSD